MSTYYRVRNWDKHFENNRTRELKRLDWVPVPNKHDGEGYLSIMAQKDGLLIYAAWHLILQVASKCGTRGTLLRDDGTPLTALAIALKTGCRKEKAVQRALDFCSSPQVGWLERLERNPAGGCDNPAGGCLEGKGREEKRSEGKDPPEAAPKSLEKKTYGELGSVRLSDDEYAKLIARHSKTDVSAAIEILDGYIAAKGKRYANHYAVMKEGSWVWTRLAENGKYAQPKRLPTLAETMQ